ncbi:hypothetical protein COK37_30620 [Bacillus thuringiensis]|uniref:hypothetical protein n=1 Tax=Bacillus thuringiensis TaxID=1428 RepID=UPI000BF96A7A|nr:hypothetical protein [Bacillus thuringiensis]PEV36753.1 hypothetical protein CN432_31110 [Bacillus thuringiensis]PFF71107.1 hypothetical protein CN339_26240 [Bacillus thuringiensis]PFR62603.1 hypothetical protein COK37_30620 [Bacillus thuringiensis]PFT74678.1 hypothetical protein COK70_27860 [Bacillus thuringiensis]PFV82212.1 hypothetical protein COL06_29385 [Bacillus thuringiensis]
MSGFQYTFNKELQPLVLDQLKYQLHYFLPQLEGKFMLNTETFHILEELEIGLNELETLKKIFERYEELNELPLQNQDSVIWNVENTEGYLSENETLFDRIFEKEFIEKVKKFITINIKVQKGLNIYNKIWIDLLRELDEKIYEYFSTIFELSEIYAPHMIELEELERTGYLKNSFHHLCYTSHTAKDYTKFPHDGIERSEIGKHVDVNQKYVLNPALCLHVYPQLRDKQGVNNTVYTIKGSCFRDESGNLNNTTRLLEFVMREFIFFGTEEFIAECHKKLVDFWILLMKKVNLKFEIKIANDIFFDDNTDSKLFSQVYSDNKLELAVHVKDLEVSVSSINKHMYHFSDVYNITNESGKLAQTMCMGLGYNRILEMISRENQNREAEK